MSLHSSVTEAEEWTTMLWGRESSSERTELGTVRTGGGTKPWRTETSEMTDKVRRDYFTFLKG